MHFDRRSFHDLRARIAKRAEANEHFACAE